MQKPVITSSLQPLLIVPPTSASSPMMFLPICPHALLEAASALGDGEINHAFQLKGP